MKLKLLFIALLQIVCFARLEAAYVPLTVTSGYNADVIANGVGTGLATTTNDVDGVNYCYFSNGWQQLSTSTPATTGLPATGVINSLVTSGLTFQLANYTGNNDLRITSTGNGTLVFQTPQAAQNFYLAAVSGSGSSTATVQINFSDGTNQSSTITVADWYGGANAAITGFQRMNRSTMALDNNTSPVGPNIYQYSFSIPVANQTKLISSVLVTRTGGSATTSVLNVFAASIQQSTITCAAPTSPTATNITTTTAQLDWAQVGTPGQWQIKYGAPGFNVATAGTAVFTATKPYTLNPPLTLGTSYDYYVRAVCGANDTSAWSPVTSFTTLCNPPAVVSKKDSFSCGTSAVNLEATTVSGASIKWYAALTGGTALATGNIYTTPVISTTTNYYITAISGTCESSPRQMVTATIRAIPVVNIGNDTTICPGVSYTFNAGNAGASYLWSTGETTQSVTKNAAGTYIVGVTVNGCIKRDTIIVTPGITPVNIMADTVNLCNGAVANLNAGNAGSSYVWSPGGATTQVVPTSAQGNNSVVIKSIHGCVITSHSFVKLRPLPVNNLGNDTLICQSATIVLNAGNPGYNFSWSTGAATQTINASDSATYIVTVTTPYNCVNVDSLHIGYLPSPKIEGFNFVPRFYDEMGKVDFSPLNPTNVNTYEWNFGDGSLIVTQMNPSHIYTTSGEFDVSLKVINNCTDYTTSQKISVGLPPVTGIGSVNINSSLLKLYPNPARSVLTISNGGADFMMEDVFVYNTLGAEVFHGKYNKENVVELGVSQFANGLYLLKVVTDKGIVSGKFQVTK